jgi:2-methylisocitrate lyase-like PEP mutase family enzyme
MNSPQESAAERFRAMHDSGCFVLANPWDIGTAIYLEHIGFKALATMLAHIREIVNATALPVNADFMAGYADEPKEVAENVRLCIDTGVAGLSIEDNSGRKDSPLYEKKLATERIGAARAAIDDSKTAVVLTGRCEAWLIGDSNPLHTALDRLSDYADSGADCLYAPGVSEPDEIAQIVKTVAPKPVNVLVSGFNHQLSLSQLADLGVRRISVGSGLSLAAWGAFLRAVQDIKTNGVFNLLANGAASVGLNELFQEKS